MRDFRGLLKLAQTNDTERAAYPGSRNNPGNMRYFGVGWLGEQPAGLQRGQFTRFSTPQLGLRAMIRNIMNIGSRQPSFTIDNVVPVYSPGVENDTESHASNISSVSGIPRTDVLDPSDNGQMVDLARGLVQAESGARAAEWFTPQEYTNAVISARSSQ